LTKEDLDRVMEACDMVRKIVYHVIYMPIVHFCSNSCMSRIVLNA